FEHESTLAESLAIGIGGFLTKDIPAPELAELIKQAHSGRQVMGPKPVEILTASYIASQHDREEFRDFIDAVEGMSERLVPVYELLLESTTNKIIARKLKLSESTVRNYVSEILEITNCRSRGELAMTATKAGLLI
ncbi:MAG: response regulator transcription factor, partial [Actinomycetaceae bacterium]|nr:response regulator transcription factor [Actinomycetaceae bacterium]